MRSYEPVHIGKSSAGWDFLFNLNGENYYFDKASLIEWLKSVEITNEYGTVLSFDEFWSVVTERSCNEQNTKGHRGASNDPSRYIVIDGLEFLDCYFS